MKSARKVSRVSPKSQMPIKKQIRDYYLNPERQVHVRTSIHVLIIIDIFSF